MNNVVLDTAIGLVFIYLLYSLLATAINEFVAMIFAYRHRMLEKAIEQMLDGKNYSYYWWDKLINWIKWIYRYIMGKNKEKNNKPASEALNERDFLQNKPINKKNAFVYVAEKKKAQEEIKENKSNKKNIKLKFKEDNKSYIKRVKLNKKASLFAANIINHPLYRRKSEQSILYKKPAYLSASAFSDILFDVLSGRKSKESSVPILMNNIKAFLDTDEQLKNNKGLKSILNLYIEQANGDIRKFKLLLEDWFDDSMNRVSGWYKRQATKVLFMIGLVLAFVFNVSTIEIVNKLSVNKDLREAMAKSASNYVEQRRSEINSDKNSSDSSLEAAKKQIENIQKLYNDTIAAVNMMMGLGWGDFGYKEKYVPIIERRRNKDSVFIAGFLSKLSVNKPVHRIKLYSKGKSIGELQIPPDPKDAKKNLIAFLNTRFKVEGHASFCEKLRYIFTFRNIIGFLITALAITLGAPFWFDLLNKFVNIRAGGKKPSEGAGSSSGTTAVSKTVALNQKPAINSFG